MYVLEFLEDDRVSEVKKPHSFKEALSDLKHSMNRRGYAEAITHQTVDKKEDHLDKEDSFNDVYVHYDAEEDFLRLDMCRGHEAYRIGRLNN